MSSGGLVRRLVRRSAQREGGSARREGGFTIVELLVAMLLTLLVTGALFGLVVPARGLFEAQPEISDVHQRLRVAVDLLTRDLQMAGTGIAPEAAPAVMPYRVGPVGSDAAAGVFYRPAVLTVLAVPSSTGVPESRTYYLRPDPATGTPQLMRYDGTETDLPVIDSVAGLDLVYFDAHGAPIDPAALQDGPWRPSDPDVDMFDADLLRIRRVRVVLRLAAARRVPEHAVQFDVALRNAGAAW
ncbi:MAG: prepilin-type N-terminal cleavage/methylation domain-containing protein [Acidobacteria bacterium]|nr:prepilin-type N-terminal cleavage/methylation domain-containing protein [Acidobacteriota bacterium]